MSTRRILTIALTAALAFGAVPSNLLARQENGLLAGKATSEAKKPFTDYVVQLRDPQSAQIVKTTTLGAQGQFSFTGVLLSRRLVVELKNTKTNKVVCTEGPYVLTQTQLSRTDVDINCGASPAWWLLAAAAGAGAGVAVLTASGG